MKKYYSETKQNFPNLANSPKYEKTENKIQVQSITLDTILNDNKIEKCDILKLDCEGAEYEILMTYFSKNYTKSAFQVYIPLSRIPFGGPYVHVDHRVRRHVDALLRHERFDAAVLARKIYSQRCHGTGP